MEDQFLAPLGIFLRPKLHGPSAVEMVITSVKPRAPIYITSANVDHL